MPRQPRRRPRECFCDLHQVIGERVPFKVWAQHQEQWRAAVEEEERAWIESQQVESQNATTGSSDPVGNPQHGSADDQESGYSVSDVGHGPAAEQDSSELLNADSKSDHNSVANGVSFILTSTTGIRALDKSAVSESRRRKHRAQEAQRAAEASHRASREGQVLACSNPQQ